MGDRWLSVEVIVAYLNIKRDAIYKWIEHKQILSHKVGRRRKYRKEEVDQCVRNSNTGDYKGDACLKCHQGKK
ncbi:MAG: excisionase family DNA-binding protein [Candidatus Thiodiazotropha sp. (ex Dulcina madagascariensis)]|nr:excisionase family DNA-binding protein [Candidatus Thiodiazotropha sp. (ex Dulcina madagascariensis)]